MGRQAASEKHLTPGGHRESQFCQGGQDGQGGQYLHWGPVPWRWGEGRGKNECVHTCVYRFPNTLLVGGALKCDPFRQGLITFVSVVPQDVKTLLCVRTPPSAPTPLLEEGGVSEDPSSSVCGFIL